MSAFYEGLAEIFEVDAAEIGATFSLVDHNWDSLAIVSVIALADECHNMMLAGSDLVKCETVSDIEALIAETQVG